MLEAQGIVRRVDGKTIVDGIDLTLAPGEVVGLLGPGGAGKTTTFRLIAGLVPLAEGRVLIDGIDVSRLPLFARARLGLGILPQEPSIHAGLSVEENILIALEVRPLDRARRRAELERLLDRFGLERLRRMPAGRLSGGERRRCEIARTLACEARYLLLDEPFAGIDPIAVEGVRALIAGLRASGMGILITDHNARELLGSVDRAHVVAAGRILKSGSPSEVAADAAVRSLYLGAEFPSSFAGSR